MSNAVWNPETGQYGMFGTDPGSKAGKVRKAIWEEGTKLPTQTGTSQVAHELTGKDIGGLGPEKYFSKGMKGTDIHFAGLGKGQPGSGGEGHYQASPERVKEHWYNPLKKQTLLDPYAQMKVIGKGELGEGEFDLYKGQDALLPETARNIPQTDRLLPYGGDVEQALLEAGVIKEEAEESYKSTMKGLRESEEETRTGWRTARQETARSRMLAAAAAGEEHEAGETIKASTGMAYSAPASERAQLTESTKTMEDISSAAAETRTGYFKDIKDIKRERIKTEGDWTTAKRDYHGAVKEAYTLAEDALGETMSKLTGLLLEHKSGQLGAFQSQEATVGHLQGVKGMFSEQPGEMADYGLIQERIGLAEKFAETMKTAAGEQIVSEDPSAEAYY